MQKLTYDNFMNPFKGQAAINLRPKLEEFKKAYFEKYAKDILVTCVYNDRYDRYTFFFKFPSGENDKYPTAIMYDVVLEFNPPGGKKEQEQITEIRDYDILMFSNSPSFIFTFDYVVKHTYGFPHCIGFNHLSKVAIAKAPDVRNTYQLMTIEKSTWMCFFHLVHNGFLNKQMTKRITSDKSEAFYAKKVDSQPAKLKEIQMLKDLMKEEKLKEKARQNSGAAKEYSNPFSFQAKQNKRMKIIEKRNDTENFKNSMKINSLSGNKPKMKINHFKSFINKPNKRGKK